MRVAINVCATLLVSVGALVSASCAEDTDEPVLEDEGEEVVGKAQQAIGGEAACASLALSSVFGESVAITLNTQVLDSPDDKYNPGSTCPNQYIAEFTAWNTHSNHDLYVDWDIETPDTSSGCADARLTVYYYGYSGSWNTTPTGYRKYNGNWNGGVAECEWSLVASSGAEPSHSHTKVRAVALGYQWQLSGTTGSDKADFKPVKVTAATPPR